MHDDTYAPLYHERPGDSLGPIKFMITSGQLVKARMVTSIVGLGLCLISAGCQTPGTSEPQNHPSYYGAAAETKPVEIHLEYYTTVPPEDRLLQSEWSKVMTAINRACQAMRMQPTGKTNWQDGRAFPRFEGDGGEVSLLIQCIRKTPTETWIQITFFDGPEKDKRGNIIHRSLPPRPPAV